MGGQGQRGGGAQGRGRLRPPAALSVHLLPLPLPRTPGFPRHKVTTSAYSPCPHLPGLWPPPPSVPLCDLISPSSPMKIKVRSWRFSAPTHGSGPQCHSEQEPKFSEQRSRSHHPPSPGVWLHHSSHTGLLADFSPHPRAFARSVPAAGILSLQMFPQLPLPPPRFSEAFSATLLEACPSQGSCRPALPSLSCYQFVWLTVCPVSSTVSSCHTLSSARAETQLCLPQGQTPRKDSFERMTSPQPL